MASTAFALAGLGGFNAHGAGFLKAAREANIVPDLVTATSGQIVVLADWFRGKDLEDSLGVAPFGSGPLTQFAMAMSGNPGVFRPAYQEALMRWWTPPKAESLTEAMIDRMMPAQLFVPTRDQGDFGAIAETLNKEAVIDGRPVGVIFNTYNLETGEAALFGNDAARAIWPVQRSIPSASRSNLARKGDNGEAETVGGDEPALGPITPEAVRSALWLSLYGFEHLPEPHLIDGAYHRSCIVAELHRFDRVFVARPLAPGWRGRPPRNWLEIQDWQIEMWFSVGYKAEVDALHKINGLVRQGLLGDPYRFVDIVEVAPHKPAGFFNYFIERKPVYKSAYQAASEAFAKYRAG